MLYLLDFSAGAETPLDIKMERSWIQRIRCLPYCWKGWTNRNDFQNITELTNPKKSHLCHNLGSGQSETATGVWTRESPLVHLLTSQRGKLSPGNMLHKYSTSLLKAEKQQEDGLCLTYSSLAARESAKYSIEFSRFINTARYDGRK